MPNIFWMLFLLLFLSPIWSFAQKSSDFALYYNSKPINLKEGIKLSEIVEPKESAAFGYNIRTEVAGKIDSLFSYVRMTLARRGKGLKHLNHKVKQQRDTIDVEELFRGLIPGDHIVVEWKLVGDNLSYSPKFMTIAIIE